MEASIDKYGKQVASQKDDMNRWNKRYLESKKSLDSLMKEIAESVSFPVQFTKLFLILIMIVSFQNLKSFLMIYVKGKNMELEVSRANAKIQHVHKINSIYQDEGEHWRKTLSLSCEIIQQKFLMLYGSGLVDVGLRDKLDKLMKLVQGQRSVTFGDENDHDYSDYTTLNISLTDMENGNDKALSLKRTKPESFDGVAELPTEKKIKMKLFKEESIKPSGSSASADKKVFKIPSAAVFAEPTKPIVNFNNNLPKRRERLFTAKPTTSTQIILPPPPVMVPSTSSSNIDLLNATQVISSGSFESSSSSTIDPLNSTFCLDVNPPTTVKPILTERNVNNQISPSKIIKKISSNKIMSKINLGLAKENKQRTITSRVGKSPKPIGRPLVGISKVQAQRHYRTKSNSSSSGMDTPKATILRKKV